jgi:hypothetical protein
MNTLRERFNKIYDTPYQDKRGALLGFIESERIIEITTNIADIQGLKNTEYGKSEIMYHIAIEDVLALLEQRLKS